MALFGRRTPAPPPEEPGRTLRLAHSLEVENMAAFAADVVASSAEITRTVLDYSPESLALVDGILQGFADDGVTEADVGETLVAFGAYVGEVLVRNVGGTWLDLRGHEAQGILGPLPMVVQLPDGQLVNPIGKAFKRLADPADDLVFSYEAFTTPRG